MEGDVPEQTVTLRSDLRTVLAALPLFHGLSAEILNAIAAEVEWLSLPGGSVLFSAGDTSDSMYVVLLLLLARPLPPMKWKSSPP